MAEIDVKAQPERDHEAWRGLPEKELAELLQAGLKPEEIGVGAEQREARATELVHWFSRYLNGQANPKWFHYHALELAYYVATTPHPAPNRLSPQGIWTSPCEEAWKRVLGTHNQERSG